MGASEWRYYIPYQPDIRQAFHNLRELLFQRGHYYLREPYWKAMTFEEWIAPADVEDFEDDERAEYEATFRRLQALEAPTTIDELLEWNGEEGTSSILDMLDIANTPELFTVAPLTHEQLTAIFGTIQPTREMIEQADGAYHKFRETASGLYIIVYHDGLPVEIFFTGFSGD